MAVNPDKTPEQAARESLVATLREQAPYLRAMALNGSATFMEQAASEIEELGKQLDRVSFHRLVNFRNRIKCDLFFLLQGFFMREFQFEPKLVSTISGDSSEHFQFSASAPIARVFGEITVALVDPPIFQEGDKSLDAEVT